MKGLGPHLLFLSQFRLRIYPTLLQGFAAGPGLYTGDVLCPISSLTRFLNRAFLYRFYLLDEYRENSLFPDAWIVDSVWRSKQLACVQEGWLDPEIWICDPVTLPPLRTAIIMSPITALARTGFGTGIICENILPVANYQGQLSLSS